MNREQTIRFCNENIFPQVNISVAHFMDCFEVIHMVEKWRVGKPIDVEMRPEVVDGFLKINGDPVGRIAPKMPKVAWSEEGYYWERKCLEKAGL